MKIVITGANGLIGSYLSQYFSAHGHDVWRVLRKSKASGQTQKIIHWNPSEERMDSDLLEGTDCVIHLAGATISQPWTPAYKEVLRQSRIDSTRLLCRRIVKLQQKPKILISASAIGYYGNHPSRVVVDEKSKAGDDFLAKLCQDWESETQIAQQAGIRVVNVRTGIVLAHQGGALAKMLPIFQWGLGGVLGKGDQMMSWIALVEIPYIMEHLITRESISGPINMVAPQAVSNRVFTQALANALKCPAIFPVPSFGIRMLFGEMGQSLLLEGVNVVPSVLLNSGYRFRYDDLNLALQAALKR